MASCVALRIEAAVHLTRPAVVMNCLFPSLLSILLLQVFYLKKKKKIN